MAIYIIIVMNKNVLMLCITYHIGLEILPIQSSTSQICVSFDPCNSYIGQSVTTK